MANPISFVKRVQHGAFAFGDGGVAASTALTPPMTSPQVFQTARGTGSRYSDHFMLGRFTLPYTVLYENRGGNNGATVVEYSAVDWAVGV